MSKQPKKKSENAKNLEINSSILKSIIDTQKFIKKEDILETIQKKTLDNLYKNKNDQKNKLLLMYDWHYIALFFIKNKIYSPTKIENLTFWIEQACNISETNENMSIGKFYETCSQNSAILQKNNIDEKSINFLSNSSSYLQKIHMYEEQLYLDPEFIHFISKSFRPIFLPLENRKSLIEINSIKEEMFELWQKNDKFLPNKVVDYLQQNGTKQDFYQKMRNLFQMIFENPDLYQITYFYKNHLDDSFVNTLLSSIDDNYLDKYKEHISNKSDTVGYNLDKYFQDENSSYDNLTTSFSKSISEILYEKTKEKEQLKFDENFKYLLKSADMLPTFPESFFKELHDIVKFVFDYLVQRGNLKDFKLRKDYFSKMQILSDEKGKTLEFCISKVKFENLRDVHKSVYKKIDQVLAGKNEIFNYITALFEIQKNTSYILKYNYIKTIINAFSINKKKDDSNTSTNKIVGFLFDLFKNKNAEKKDENIIDDDLYKVEEIIKDPIILKKEYIEFLDNDKSLFAQIGTIKKESDKEIEYDWNTFLIFNLVKNITFDKFLQIRQDVVIFDSSYKNLFDANKGEEVPEENKDSNIQVEQIPNKDKKDKYNSNEKNKDKKDEDNSNENNKDKKDENNSDEENKKINPEEQYLLLVDDLKNAFSDFTNPIQKVIDVYTSLTNISQFFNNEGKDLFEQKINESNVNKVKNSGWNIPFNIFDFVYIPNFVSSMIFMFDYYFLLFERNSKLKTLFVQIYNYAIKKYYPKDQLHFDIASSEEDLYQHLLLCRKSIKMIFVGNNDKGSIKNNILKTALKNSLNCPYEENEIFPMEEFIETAKEVTCYFFKNSTFYVCTILLFNKFDELNSLHIDENKKQFVAYLISSSSMDDNDEVRNFVNLINDINLTHIICSSQINLRLISLYKEKAIIHKHDIFDIKNIKIIEKI